MANRDRFDADGRPSDGIAYYVANTRQLQTYTEATAQLARFETPVFVHAGNPHEYLFVASFDGTGSDKSEDPGHWTNVAKIDDQIEKLAGASERRIARGYIPGPGVERNLLARTFDALEGHTVEARAESMYRKLVVQSKRWIDDDPDAQIRIVGIGFSRGSGADVVFQRMVHERGILDPSQATYRIDRGGLVQRATYAGAPLIPPGQVAQAAVLFDPVNTGMALEHDRRLPPSVLSAVQIFAADERRTGFEADRIIDPGLTADGRFLGLVVAGAHSDIGGDYVRDGLGVRSGNLAVDFLNSLSDRPFLQRAHEPDDPRLNVVHRSEQEMLLYRILPKVNRANPNGQNEMLVPAHDRLAVADPFNAEPRDEILNGQFEHRPVAAGGQLPAERTGERGLAHEMMSCRLDRMLEASRANDWDVFLQENRALAFGGAGREMWERAEACAVEQDRSQPAPGQRVTDEPTVTQRSAPALAH